MMHCVYFSRKHSTGGVWQKWVAGVKGVHGVPPYLGSLSTLFLPSVHPEAFNFHENSSEKTVLIRRKKKKNKRSEGKFPLDY